MNWLEFSNLLWFIVFVSLVAFVMWSCLSSIKFVWKYWKEWNTHPKYNPIEIYVHHGRVVSVRSDLKGHHREFCLCYNDCVRFNPGTPYNCEIARALYEFNMKYDLVTPVWECPEYTKYFQDQKGKEINE
jgi:hypothetical protein